MSTFLFNPRTILVASLAFGLALMAWFPALPTQAADQLSGEAIPSASMGELGVVAVSMVEDTLKACMTRIPKDASIDQRLIAETSCLRDEMDRKVIQAVPETEYASR